MKRKIKKRPWIALYSQSGNEIRALSGMIKRSPDFIIGNHKMKDITKITPNIESSTIYVHNRPSVEELTSIFETFDNPIITLHGWLRVIPAEICKRYDIYNGHPGWIVDYPELKGLNPQDKVADSIKDYEVIGSVIHKVVPEVDAGEITHKLKMNNKYYKGRLPKRKEKIKDYVYRTNTTTSLLTWIEFSKKFLK